MSRNLQNMPALYQAGFSQWRRFTANDLYGNTNAWVGAVNGGGASTVGAAYQRATTPLLTYSQTDLNTINPADAQNLKSAFAALELADGASPSPLPTVCTLQAKPPQV